MIETLHNIFSVTSELHGVVDWIIKALLWLVNKFLQYALGWILPLVYAVVIWAPLQVINAEFVMFKFFSSGFSSAIFSTTIDNRGHMVTAFDWTSTLGTIIIFVLIIALVIFFFNFIYSFTSNTTIDASGKPTYNQINRFLAFKYPIIIGILVVLTPFIMVFADWFMNAILSWFTGAQSIVVSQHDKDDITKNIFNPYNIQDLNTFWGKLNTINTVQIQITQAGSTIPLSDVLTEINQYLTKAQQSINNDTNNNNYNGLEFMISESQQYIQYIQNYIFSGMSADAQQLRTVITGLSINQYISDDSRKYLNDIITNLDKFQYAFSRASDDLTDILDPTSSYVNDWNTLINNGGNFTQSDLTSLTQYSNFFTSALTDTNSNLYQFINYSSSSYINQIIDGGTNSAGNAFIGISTLSTRYRGGNTDIVVKMLYQFATGDTNQNNWQNIPGAYNKIYSNMDIIHWVLSVFALFGMILISYNFTQSAIKRTFYLVACWILGWLFVANGMKNQQKIVTWYKSLFGRWWAILITFICFSLVSAIIPIIQKPIVDGMAKVTSSSMTWIGQFAVIFALEAAFQVAWQVSQSYAGEFGAQEQKFEAESSQTLTAGKAMAFKSVTSAKNILTGSAIRQTVNDAIGIKKFWDDRKNGKLQKENNSLQSAQRKMSFEKDKSDAASKGFIMSKSRGGYYSVKKDPNFTPPATTTGTGGGTPPPPGGGNNNPPPGGGGGGANNNPPPAPGGGGGANNNPPPAPNDGGGNPDTQTTVQPQPEATGEASVQTDNQQPDNNQGEASTQTDVPPPPQPPQLNDQDTQTPPPANDQGNQTLNQIPEGSTSPNGFIRANRTRRTNN